jgi:glutamine amidotransferase
VVRKLEAERVPQIGWNDLEDVNEPTIASSRLKTAFFANSYVCEPADRRTVTGWATHESDRFPSSVRKRNIVGVQFHPEKSSTAGVAMIAAFLAECRQ